MDGRILQRSKRPKHRRAARQRVVPALLAGGACSLVGTPAAAIQLGEIDVHSSLGQPLRASIAYALSPNEQLGDYCIFLRHTPAASGLPSLTGARLTIANGRINILGSTPIREPLLDVGLSINCPYTANLTRSYTVMLDPFEAPAAVATPTPTANTPAATPRPVAARRSTPPAPARTAPQPSAAIAPRGEYRVQVGDSLSEIASRIENRPVGLWEAVDLLFAANPDAFIDGDINKLKAGSQLAIPSFDGVTAPTVAAEVVARGANGADAQPSTASSSATYDGFEAGSEVTDSSTTPVPNAVDEAPTEPRDTIVPIERSTPVESEARIPTAEVVVDVPAASPATEPALNEPREELSAENAPSTPTDDTRTGSTALYWLAGTALALVLVLLLFGRRLRERLAGPSAPAIVDDASRPPNDDATADATDDTAEVDFEFGGQPLAESPVALDADLSAGTGLTDGNEIEVAQDFGFSTSTDDHSTLDVAFGDETTIEEELPTDILPTHAKEESTILEEEILPSDGDYDMSVIVDATKQKFGAGDVTAKDLMAVAIADATDDDAGDDQYTLTQEVDYKILEQDYEDELTATQALNKEIEKAAKELAERLDDGADASAEETLELPAEAELETTDDDLEVITDLDDTGVNEELTAEMPQRGVSSVADATAELPSPETLECDDDTTANTEITEQLPAAENDPTAEIDVESGRFRTGG